MIRFDPISYYYQELDKLIAQLNTVIDRLELQFPDSEVIYSCVYERDTWDELTTRLAKTLNWYIRTYRGIRTVNINGRIAPEHMKRDNIHFRNAGYLTFMDEGLGMVLEYYYGHRKVQ